MCAYFAESSNLNYVAIYEQKHKRAAHSESRGSLKSSFIKYKYK